MLKYFILKTDSEGKKKNDIIIGKIQNGYVIENVTNKAYSIDDVDALVAL